MFYDVDGDGRLDFLVAEYEGNNGKYKSTTRAISLDGDVVHTATANDVYGGNGGRVGEVNSYVYGFFSFLSNDGKPYWVDYHNLVYDMSANRVWGNGYRYGGFSAADLNGDGRKELFSSYLNDIVRMLPDGTFVNDKIYITTDTTALHTTENYSPNSGSIFRGSFGANAGSLADGMFVEAKPNIDADGMDDELADSAGVRKCFVREGNQLKAVSLPSGSLSASDYNGDGLVDLNDGTYIYYNLGGNRFFRSSHKGTVYSTDLTGNGLLDFIDFNNNQIDLYIRQADGSMGQPKTLIKNNAVQNVFFGDFDHDGDVDILLLIHGTDYTLFQFYRNDGNGTFRAKDANVDGLYKVEACNDYDGDGLYELLAQKKGASYYDNYSLFKIGKNWSVSMVDAELPCDVKIADFDNDGIMEMMCRKTYGDYGAYYNYNIIEKVPGAVRSTRPEKMSKPSAVAFPDANKLKISWPQGKDNETSSCDLTYELRIGTAPGKGDVYYGNANAEGTRRVRADGNMGRALSYMYDTGNLTEGKYYIAVQAVDAGQLGGAWSDELVYDHKLSAPVITTMAPGYCTADTIQLTVQNPVAAATYQWNLDKGEMISQNGNGSVASVQFTEAGKRTYSVSMTLGGSTVRSANETILIGALKGKPVYGYGDQGFDIDQDGNMEICIHGYDEYGKNKYTFCERQQDGTYSAIRKTWNTDLKTSLQYADFNRDGYPDFLDTYNEKVFYNTGEGDKSFDVEEVTITNSHNCKYLIDLNNDGKFAEMPEYQLYTTMGPYVDVNGNFNYVEKTVYDRTDEDVHYYSFHDFDRDGCFDLWASVDGDSKEARRTVVRLNRVGNTADWYFEPEEKLYYEQRASDEFSVYKKSIVGFADFNNDSYPDGYFFENGYMVIVKGKPISEWPCTETVAVPLAYHAYTPTSIPNIDLLDINNDGYLDIGYDGEWWLGGENFKFTKPQAANDFAVDTNAEYHWQPLTPGAYPNGLASGIRNEAPSVPANVTVQNVNQGNMLIKWDDSTDDHTPWAQMRYNISVKEKGKTGAGAFVLSPMNGLSDEAAILPGVEYRKATKLTVPKHVFTEGATYEVQVQAIDLMGEHSAMSKPVEFVYNRYNYISVSDEKLYTRHSYVVSYRGEYSSKITCTSDKDAKVTPWGDDQPTVFDIKWSTPGLKTVTMTDGTHTATLTVNVQDRPSLAIELPGKVMLNSPLTVRVPDVYASSVVKNVTMPQGDNYSVIYHYGDSTATFLFTVPCMTMVNVQGTLEGDTRIFTDESNIIEVVDQVMPTARLTSVEGEGRYYRVNWPTDVPSMVTQVEIARETNRLGQYETLCVLPVANATWCDLTSDNRVQPQRYRIRLLTADGAQTSDWSEPHNPLHVDINKTADGQGNNLMWNAYEGLDVQSYVILRGTSADKLQTIATVPATQLSYTDNDAPQGTCYYAVRFNEVRVMAQGVMRVERLDDKVQSNVISSDEAMPTIAATSISVVAVEKTAALSDSQPQLHLAAVILPSYATYNKVGWTIVSGSGLATIASNGVLTATGGKGDVVVRATTLDGSGLSAEITVPCDYTVRAQSISIFRPKATVKVGESVQCEAMLLPRNVSMKNVAWRSDNEQVATVDNNGVVRGVSQGTAVITAVTADGTQLTARTTLQVVESSGIHTVTAGDDADVQYFTTDGKRIEKPRRGQIYVTSKGDKVLYK